MRIRLQCKIAYFVVNSFVVSGILSKREPFQDTLIQLERFNSDIRSKYRSIGMMDEFNGIVTNMIGSLQEVQTKGEDMVTKIKTQEEKLAKVIKDIEQKEEYIKQVQFEMNQINEINKRIKSELERTKEEKLVAQRELNSVWEKQRVVLDEIRKQSAVIEEKKKQDYTSGGNILLPGRVFGFHRVRSRQCRHVGRETCRNMDSTKRHQ